MERSHRENNGSRLEVLYCNGQQLDGGEVMMQGGRASQVASRAWCAASADSTGADVLGGAPGADDRLDPGETANHAAHVGGLLSLMPALSRVAAWACQRFLNVAGAAGRGINWRPCR